MPFESLETDEKIEGAVKRPKDDDTQLLFGCGTFVMVSGLQLALICWPFFVFPKTHELSQLMIALAAAGIPALIAGVISVRKLAVAGASGFVGGAMASAAFMFLRLHEVSMGRYMHDAPQPEFPEVWTWIIPVAWVLLAAAVALLLIPKREIEPFDSHS